MKSNHKHILFVYFTSEPGKIVFLVNRYLEINLTLLCYAAFNLGADFPVKNDVTCY